MPENIKDAPWNKETHTVSLPMEKPTLGVKPQYIWREGRVIELCEAIKKFTQEQIHEIELICEWSEELIVHTQWLKNRKQNYEVSPRRQHTCGSV